MIGCVFTSGFLPIRWDIKFSHLINDSAATSKYCQKNETFWVIYIHFEMSQIFRKSCWLGCCCQTKMGT